MKKMFKKSKGFTLVELLIVVVIIGILAGMMMLSTGSATSKAEATKIVSNLRNMKAAAVMVYADANTWPSTLASLDTYLDQKISTAVAPSDNVNYKIVGSSDLVGYDNVKPEVATSLLKLKTSGVPLLTETSADYTGGTKVYMRVK